ncbi:MAG: ScpA family protein [Bdellovibrionota bacterium]
MTSKYFVKLEDFEGPLDLLLHLIRVHELDIFRIDLFVLTSQYLNYLRLLKFKDLNDAASFMEMAAILIEIKSRYLLPNADNQQNEEEIDEEDEAASLQRRLLEYDKFRRAASFLEAMPQLGMQVQTNNEWKRLEPLYSDIEGPLRGEPATLVVMYESLLSTLSDRKPTTVTAKTERISLEEVIHKMESFIEKARFVLFQKMYAQMNSRYDLVANTLSMLQLTRDGKLNIYQEELMGPIWLYRKDLELQDVPIDQDEPNKEQDNSELELTESVGHQQPDIQPD